MVPIRRPIALIAAALVLSAALGSPARASGHDVGPRPPGQFDYYVLSLSWVPGFCATNKKSPGECHKGLTFALHGLWPQLNGRNWPSNCSQVTLTPADLQAAKGVYADDSMIQHEWSNHGTCSGLAPSAYFALSTTTRRHVVIPSAYTAQTVLKLRQSQAVMATLEAANAGLTTGEISTSGAKGLLTEVDVCVTKAGAFRAC